MRPFNLDEYIKNPSKKIVTRDGRPVKIHCTNFASDQPVIATMGDEECSYSFGKDGIFMRGKYKSCHDLFFAPEKHEGWMNVYRNKETGIMSFGQVLHTSREEAEKLAKPSDYYVATAKVEWEEQL